MIPVAEAELAARATHAIFFFEFNLDSMMFNLGWIYPHAPWLMCSSCSQYSSASSYFFNTLMIEL